MVNDIFRSVSFWLESGVADHISIEDVIISKRAYESVVILRYVWVEAIIVLPLASQSQVIGFVSLPRLPGFDVTLHGQYTSS